MIDNADSIDLWGVEFDVEVEWRKDMESNPSNKNLSEAHFEHLFPHAKVHAKLIDENHSSRRSLCYSTVKHRK